VIPEIYPYQAKAVGTIFAASKPVLNAFDPGLGKTRVAIASMYARGYKRILVLCPHSVVLVWEAEIKKWWPSAPPVMIVRAGVPIPSTEGFFIVSYGLLSEASGRTVSGLVDTGPFEATILDEAHYLKNPKSNRAKRVYGLLPMLGWVHPMTGTPAPNHAGELWGIVYHLRPDLIVSPTTGKPMREGEFLSRYCNVRQFKVNNHWVEQVTGSKNLPELRARLAPMILMAKKRDVLPELPPIDFVTLPVQAHIQSHVSSQLGMLELTQDGSDDALLAQLASGVVKSEIQQLGLAKVEAVVEWIEDLLASDDKRRLVVWCVHHAVIDRYAELLGQYKPVTFDGRNNLDQRREAIQRFMTGTARIFVGQIVAGGTGITLVSKTAPCSDVIFAESSFSPADNFQAACRVHRIGQRDGVLVRHAAAAGTLDDRIQEILARKSRELTELFG
jgi:SWI/SNF-related matrix-associated actin-dependent regulator 1 of chromatin subfamily A